MYPAVGKALETCTNPGKSSFVFGPKGRTWNTVFVDQEARGEDAEAFKTRDFVNSKYTICLTRADYIKHRGFEGRHSGSDC